MLSWLVDEAKDDETSARNLAIRILTINFASIHTSTMASRAFVLLTDE